MSDRDRLDRPHFIIIGAMKCATSTLHEQLAGQAGVFMSTPKEPNFFSDEENWRKGLKWYRDLFADAPRDALCGESSTHYTKLPTYPRTVDRMADHLRSDARFIYVIRHPIDRLISQYIHEWTQRNVSGSIDEALETDPAMIEYSRYAMQVQPYLERFGPDAVLPVFFERLTASPQHELARIAEFVGIDGETQWRESNEAENVSAERVRKSPIRSFVRAVPGLRPLLHRVLPESTRESLKAPWRMDERPQLSAANVERLTAIFDEDLAMLTPWIEARLADSAHLPLTCANFKDIARATVERERPVSEALP